MKNIARTAKGSDISGEESGDELGGLSDSDLDDIFNDLDKKVKTETTAKTKTVIPKELEGLGLESLLDELDEALKCKAPVFKPVIVANKSWWVPENNGQLLAVQIDQPQKYKKAIISKMANLAEEWGGDGTGAGISEQLPTTGGVNVPSKPRGPGTIGEVRDTEQQQDSGEDQRGGSRGGKPSTDRGSDILRE